MNYQALKTEILTGPLAAELVGKSDNEISDVLNDMRYTAVKSRFITVRTMLAELAGTGAIIDKLDVAAASIPEVREALRYLRGETGIDVGHPGTIAQLDALVAGGVLTNDEAESVKAMAMQPISRAELLGWQPVNYNDVNIARAL